MTSYAGSKWAELTKQDQEMQGAKSIEERKPGAQCFINRVKHDEKLKSNRATDLRRRYALQRRGITMDMAGVMTNEVHETWVNALLRAYLSLERHTGRLCAGPVVADL